MIEFEELTHTYRLNGEIIPSVSELLKFKFPDKYSGVPDYIMHNSADFGTKVHEAIQMSELYEMSLESALKCVTGVYERLCLEQYYQLKEKSNFKAVEQEQIVFTKNYAGRFDMIIEVDGKKYLADIKTTAELDLEYLSWQLSLYEYAYGKVDGLYAIWLPKKKLGKFEKIKKKTKKEIEELVKEFYEHTFGNYTISNKKSNTQT